MRYWLLAFYFTLSLPAFGRDHTITYTWARAWSAPPQVIHVNDAVEKAPEKVYEIVSPDTAVRAKEENDQAELERAIGKAIDRWSESYLTPYVGSVLLVKSNGFAYNPDALGKCCDKLENHLWHIYVTDKELLFSDKPIPTK